MLAILLLLAASLVGLSAAARLKIGIGPWTRVGLGVALGQALLLFLPFSLAAALDLPARTAGVAALCLSAALCAPWLLDLRQARSMLRRGVRSLAQALASRDNRGLVLTGGAFWLLLAWLHHTHYLLPGAGGLYSAGVTWGDLPIHLALATRFLHAEGFPALEHPLFVHGPLSYPFLPDYSVAVLAALGLPLRWAFIAGGMLPLSALLLLMNGLSRLWLQARASLVPALMLALYLLAGGLGFALFALRLWEGAPLIELLAAHNATDLPPHIAKTGHIGNLFLAARTAAYGMPIGVAALLLLGHVRESSSPPRMAALVAGLLGGALPLVHSHSFLVVSGMVVCYVATARRRAPFALCLMAVACLALPQVAWLMRASGEGSDRGFVRLAFGFLRVAPSAKDWLLDLGLGMGVWLVLVPLALWLATPRARRLAGPLLLLLPLANLVTFTPSEYDNVKLLAWFDIAAAALVAALLSRLLERGRPALATLLLFGCTASGALAVGHELANRGRVLSHHDIQVAALVSEHTPHDAVVATAASYHDPVALLSGRRVLIAAPYMLQTHGIDVHARARDLVALYAGGPSAAAVIRRFGVTAVVVGPRERQDLPAIDEPFLARHSQAKHELEGTRLYILRH